MLTMRSFFQVVGEDGRKRHSFKLIKRGTDYRCGRFEFASRVCVEWNTLDGYIVALGQWMHLRESFLIIT